MQSLSWVGVAGPAISALMPMHGEVSEGANDFVLWALPAVKLLFNVSGAAVTGALVLAYIALSPDSRAYARALNFAGASAVVWTLASIVAAVLDYLDKWGEPIAFTESFGQRLILFFTDVGLGQLWVTTTVIISVIPLLCFGSRRLSVAAVAAVLAIAGWVPLALMGHPNYGEAHEAGIVAFALHIVSAAVWLGGLMALIVLRPVLEQERLRHVVLRYSTLALVSFVVLVFSGVLRAQVTVGTVENLVSSPFGALVAVKMAAILFLGVIGFVQRRWVLSFMDREPSGRQGAFWWLVAFEVLVMALASGAAVTLLRQDEPVPVLVVDYRVLAESMADEPLPPAPGVGTFLTETLFDPLWIVLVVVGLFCYIVGVRRVVSHGAHWPATRTLSWTAGMLVLLYVTSGGVNQYQNFLLSAQVLAQMSLATVVAPLLVLGRPVGLALLVVRPREDGSRGVREWIQAASRSRVSSALVQPHTAAGLVMASVLAYYLSPLLEWSARELLGHQWMVVHFLSVGCLFATSVLRGPRGDAPSRRRARNAVLAVAVFYALFGGWMVTGAPLLSADWYAAMERPWGIDPLVNQRLGGWYVLLLGVAQAAGLTALLSRRSNPAAPDGSVPLTSAEQATVTGPSRAGDELTT